MGVCVGMERALLENRFQQLFVSFIVAPEIFCQKESSSSRVDGKQLEHSTIAIPHLQLQTENSDINRL